MAVMLGCSLLADPAAAQNPAKKSNMPVTVIEKSTVVAPRQDRLDIAKGHRTKPDPGKTAEKDPIAVQEDIDPLELLVPTDPHVDERPAKMQEKPTEKPRKQSRKTAKTKAKTSRPIDIALKKGKLVLNRFHTLKFDMAHNECRTFPSLITSDYKLPSGAIDTLADNLTIIQKRICATNGSIMVTCYQNLATVSLRRARPDDGCGK